MPATPVLSNGGTGRGLPISCYLNSVSDSLEGIVGTWNENVWLASARRRHRHLLGQRPRHRRAGRPQRQDQRHHPVRAGDGFPDAGDQPGLAAARLGRLLSRHQPSGDRGVPRDPQAVGDFNRKALNLHHGVLVTDEFMEAVRDGADSTCVAQGRQRSRQGRRPRPVPEAGRDPPCDRRALHHLLDKVNRSMPKHHRDLGLKVSTSNLCSEITLGLAGGAIRPPIKGGLPRRTIMLCTIAGIAGRPTPSCSGYCHRRSTWFHEA